MNFVIPMAGNGARFVQAGYKKPKMLLDAHQKALLQWSLDSLPLNLASVVVFVGLKEHEEKFALADKIRDLYPEINSAFVFLDEVTRGQAETVWYALPHCNADEPLVIFNIDTYFHSLTLETILKDTTHDGVMGCFTSTEDRFSFAALDDENRYVTDVREKEAISDHALTGLYTFKNVHDFSETYNYHMQNRMTTKGEYYIAPMYNYLIARGRKYVLDYTEKHYILGTPAEFEAFVALEVV
jgi:dTDP-glucose pyrophosphorylase